MPQILLRGAAVRKPLQGLGGSEVECSLPAESGREPGIDPLQAFEPLEQGHYVPGERGSHRGRQHLRLHGDVAHQVPHRAHRFAPRPVVGRRNDHPGGHDIERPAVQCHLGGNRSVRRIVEPAFVVGEGDGATAVEGRRTTTSAEHHEPLRGIGENLAEIDLAIHEVAAVEFLGPRITSADPPRPRQDREL